MKNLILIVSLYGFAVGLLGTGLGGLISLFIKGTDKILSFLLGLTAGFMLFIVTFHLLPEAFILSGILVTLLGIVLGIILVIFIEIYLDGLIKNPLTRSGLLLGISIAVHNFPEGLALGSSFMTMSNFGPTLAVAMLLHNIPEGLSMAIPLKANRLSPLKILAYSALAGLPTGIGAFFGAYIGSISNTLISLCLSFAGGTMLYIIADEIIPGAKILHKGRASSIGIVLGFALGIILYFK